MNNSKFEVVNLEASHLAIRRGLPGANKMEGFYRKERWGKDAINKRKEKLFLGLDIFWQERQQELFVTQIASFVHGG